MPKYEKGILGYKKHPKKQILFSFGSNEYTDGYWPSDSDDSDYDPDDEFIDDHEEKIRQRKQSSKTKKPHKKQRSSSVSDSGDSLVGSSPKKKKLKTGRKSKKKHVTKLSSTPVHQSKNITMQTSSDNLWNEKIPPEILLKIFGFVVQECGSVPFLPRASRVCHLWNVTASDATLWSDVDLSFGWIKRNKHILQWLCENRLSMVKKLDLNGWQKIVDNEFIALIGSKCPVLEEINLRGCMRVKSSGLSELLDSCPGLHSIDISNIPDAHSNPIVYKSDVVSMKSLNHMVATIGGQLKFLNISHHMLTGCSSVVKNIASTCKHLWHLELCNITTGDFLNLNIEALQQGCPELRVLQLSCTPFKATPKPRAEATQGIGFSKLEKIYLMCEFSNHFTAQGPTDDVVPRLLRTSEKLRVLDLRCCRTVSASCLVSLCCTDITHLYLGWSSVPKQAAVASVFRKWNHSLIELEVGNCACCDGFPDCVKSLGHPQSKLNNLNLVATNVTMDAVRDILRHCTALSCIDLSSCRSLDKGFKRKYSGDEIAALMSRISI